MSARSSLPSCLLVLAAACGGKSAPEADPALVKARAKTMIDNTPAPAGAKECTTAQMAGPQLTARSLILLAGNEMPTTPERKDWINPEELDDPAVRTLVTPGADETARRQAAATWLAYKSHIVWRPETVGAPMALGFKELKRGAVSIRAIGYDDKGDVTCLTVFSFKNDKQVSDWAMDKSDKAELDPAIVKALQQDLKKQLILKVTAIRGGEAP